MDGENKLLLTDDPVEFEKQPVEVQDYRILPVDLENLKNMPPFDQKSPRAVNT